jgi:capsular exopolysaccharide synthesis family protein
MANRPVSRFATSTAHPDYIDLGKTWRAVRSRRTAIGALLLAFLASASLLIVAIDPLYTARATLLVQPLASKPWLAAQPHESAARSEEMLQTQVSLIQSRGVAESVVRELNLATHPLFDIRQQQTWATRLRTAVQGPRLGPVNSGDADAREAKAFAKAVEVLMDRTTVAITGESRVLSIDVTLQDPQLAATVANALARGYVQRLQQLHQSAASGSSQWMKGRMAELRDSLQASEARLQAYREAHHLTDLDGSNTQGLNDFTLNTEHLIDARRQRAEAESQYRQLQAIPAQDWQQLANVPAVLADTLVQELKTAQAKADAKVQQLSARYASAHPALLAAQAELSTANASLRSRVAQVCAGITNDYQLALANESALRDAVDASKAQLQTASRESFELQALRRDVDNDRNTYNAFDRQLRETEAGKNVDVRNVRVIDAALSTQPSGPRKATVLFTAALLALMLGTAWALLRGRLHQTFNTAADLAGKIDLPLWSVLPRIARRARRTAEYCFERDQDPGFCEGIRTLRTCVTLTDSHLDSRVLLVTSSIPGEGKSTVAANMAFALSKLQKVLLIEADLRRPALAERLGMNPRQPGLADLVADRALVSECLHRDGNIDVIAAGTSPHDPQAILTSTRFAELLAQWAVRYDRVIIDSPSTLSVSDSALLAHQADGVIYVIKADSTAVSLVRKGIAHLQRSGATFFGIVLNQADPDNLLPQQPQRIPLQALKGMSMAEAEPTAATRTRPSS